MVKTAHKNEEVRKHTAAECTTGNAVLTIPGVEHIGDKVVYEGDLRFGHAAGVPVEHRHHHRQPLSLLLVCLQVKHTQIAMTTHELHLQLGVLRHYM